MFPEGAGYAHDKLEQREELAPEQRAVEPANADSHLAFIAGGLQSCVIYNARRPGPGVLRRSGRHEQRHAAPARDDARRASTAKRKSRAAR